MKQRLDTLTQCFERCKGKSGAAERMQLAQRAQEYRLLAVVKVHLTEYDLCLGL